MANPFERRPTLRPLTPAEEWELQQRRAPTPETAHLNPRERACLAAYRKRLAAARRAQAVTIVHDPLYDTWMK
jgi:hypothetical protein